MGTGRTLNKDPRTRPIKSQGEKRRRTKAQRARLVKFGMDKDVVAKMQSEAVRVLVQRPTKVAKMLAKAAAKPAAEAPAKPVKAPKTEKVPKAKAAPKAKPKAKAAPKAE